MTRAVEYRIITIRAEFRRRDRAIPIVRVSGRDSKALRSAARTALIRACADAPMYTGARVVLERFDPRAFGARCVAVAEARTTHTDRITCAPLRAEWRVTQCAEEMLP